MVVSFLLKNQQKKKGFDQQPRGQTVYTQEIDLFQQLGIKHIYLSDANVGQYDEDVDMIEYFGQKNLQENAEFRISGNYSKLRKDVNLKIFNQN